MNQSNKALIAEVAEVILECAKLYHEAYGQEVGERAIDTWQTSNEPEYTATQAITLVTNHIKVALPEKKETPELSRHFKSLGTRENQGKRIGKILGYNQALDEAHQLLKDMGAE